MGRGTNPIRRRGIFRALSGIRLAFIDKLKTESAQGVLPQEVGAMVFQMLGTKTPEWMQLLAKEAVGI